MEFNGIECEARCDLGGLWCVLLLYLLGPPLVGEGDLFPLGVASLGQDVDDGVLVHACPRRSPKVQEEEDKNRLQDQSDNL